MMPRLSNFFGTRNANLGDVACRPVQRHEIEPALRVMLAEGSGPASDEAVLDFLAFAIQRKIDLNQMWAVWAGGRIVWTLLPIPSAGRTMLIFTPVRFQPGVPIEAARLLTDKLCQYWAARDIDLVQFLLDPKDIAVRNFYLTCGFEFLAELIYLKKTVRQTPDINLPRGFRRLAYDSSTHALFAQTILQSYQGSLDCPMLNGRRHIDDVISGHKATGQFDPSLWSVLLENDDPRGVLILSPSHNADTLELVYLGLAPEARGRGLGDLLMRMAVASVVQQQRSGLTLAVDSRNTPALNLYHRHGLRRIGSRIALLRDLRATASMHA